MFRQREVDAWKRRTAQAARDAEPIEHVRAVAMEHSRLLYELKKFEAEVEKHRLEKKISEAGSYEEILAALED